MTTRRTLLASAALAPLLAAPCGATSQAAAQEATPAATQDAIDQKTDVAYGEADDQELLLDIYRPPTREAPRPAVILIHGGGWTKGYGERSNMAGAAKLLAEAGYVAVNVSYRLLDGEPGHNVWPAQLDDVQRAVRWVRANAATYALDPERIASYGHSAGGHLAAMLGVRETRDNDDPTLADYSSRVTCVVDLAGDMDLALPYPAEFDNQLVIDLLGGTVEEIPEVYRDASPLSWVDAETVPFLVIHSAADEVNPVAHAREMVETLHEASVESVYVELASGSHMAPGSWALSGPWVLTFLAIHLHPEW